jgi:hypothetical protein
VEIRAVFFPKDAPANPKTIQTSQHDDVVRPSIPKSQNP